MLFRSNQSTATPKGDLVDENLKSESTDDELVDESTDDSEASENEQDEDKAEKEKPKKKSGGFQRRINKLNSRLSAKEEEAEYWRQEYLKAKAPNNREEKSVVVKKDDGKPRADDFETHEEYIEALTDWKTEQKLNAFEEKRRSEKVQKDYQTRAQTHAERVKAFSAKHEDFAEVIDEVSDIRVPGALQELIIDSEFGPELMYELAKDREELERICAMSPIKAAKAIGRIEDKLESRSKSKTESSFINKKKPVNPPTPIRSRSDKATKPSIYDENISQAQYEALRQAERAKRWK